MIQMTLSFHLDSDLLLHDPFLEVVPEVLGVVLLCCCSFAGLIIIGQYKAITAQNGFNWRISDEFQEAQDNQFFLFLALKFPFLRSGTPKIGSGRSNLYVGRWSRSDLKGLEL